MLKCLSTRVCWRSKTQREIWKLSTPNFVCGSNSELISSSWAQLVSQCATCSWTFNRLSGIESSVSSCRTIVHNIASNTRSTINFWRCPLQIHWLTSDRRDSWAAGLSWCVQTCNNCTCKYNLKSYSTTGAKGSIRIPPPCLQIYQQPPLILIFDLLTPKIDRFMPLPHGPCMPICIKITSFIFKTFSSLFDKRQTNVHR